jgi:hypothetical protein
VILFASREASDKHFVLISRRMQTSGRAVKFR